MFSRTAPGHNPVVGDETRTLRLRVRILSLSLCGDERLRARACTCWVLRKGSGPLSRGEAPEVRDPPLADRIGADE